MSPGKDARNLEGEKVAFTGKLISMTRSQAVELVRLQGGRWLAQVNRFTSLLVVGQDGWSLDRQGRLTAKLQKAKNLQSTHPIQIITEENLLVRLGIDSSAERFQRLSIIELSKLLHLPGSRIRNWIDLGVIKPAETKSGIHYFDFRQVSWAKAVLDFASRGVSPDRIRRSLCDLRKWLPEAEEPLAQLAILEKDGRLLVRRGDNLVEMNGQINFDFSAEAASTPLAARCGPQSSRDWFLWAFDKEQAGEFAEAARGYRKALLAGGPDAETCFNLGNVLYALGKHEQAAERYRQAVKIDPSYAEGWNNLGTVLWDLSQEIETLEAYQQAVRVAPDYADAHYNLADFLDQTGQLNRALPHWQNYLRLCGESSSHRDFAQERLAH